jgi:hypothetical protein
MAAAPAQPKVQTKSRFITGIPLRVNQIKSHVGKLPTELDGRSNSVGSVFLRTLPTNLH